MNDYESARREEAYDWAMLHHDARRLPGMPDELADKTG